MAPDPWVSVRSRARSRAGQAAALGVMRWPPCLHPTVAAVAPLHSGCARACSHAAASPTLPRGRTAFPAPGCHSSLPSCSKIPVKPLSRVWGVSPQPHSSRTPLWGTEPPWHGTAMCCWPAGTDSPGRETQRSGWAAAVAWPAQAGANDAATLGGFLPATAAVGSVLWVCRGAGVHLMVVRAGALQSYQGELSPPAGHPCCQADR